MVPEIEELKKFRDENCIVARVASRDIGITERHLYRLERNAHRPKPDTLEKIKNYLKTKKAEMEKWRKKQIETIESPLLELINSGEYQFLPKPIKPGRYQPQVEKNGVLYHSVYLKNLVPGLKQTEEIIIKTLEALTHEGRIKIHKLSIAPQPANNDIRIHCEVGTGQRDLISSQVTETRLYKDVPLDIEELKSKGIILNLDRQIKDMRKRKHASFQKKYGMISDGSAIEKQLRLEDEFDRRKEREELILNRQKLKE